MTNEPSWDDIFSPGGSRSEEPATQDDSALPSRRQLREMESTRPKSTFATVTGGDGGPPRKRKRRLGWIWVVVAIVLVGGAAGTAAWNLFEPQIRHVLGIEAPSDYTGDGNGEKVDVTIGSGDVGSVISKTLATDGVTMTPTSFYKLLIATTPTPTFLPGTYSLEKEMSSASALKALQDPKNRVVSTVLIPEGRTLPQVLDLIAKGTGLKLTDLQAASADYVSLGVPKGFPSIEGYLFPAKYTFDPGTSAKAVLQAMVDRMQASLDKAGVEKSDALAVLTLASIVQKEGGTVDDFPKVSRVFHNRLDKGMALQSDATVSYGAGGKSIFTTAAQRADKANKYNTYANKGLPVGPISAPGDAAIEAAIDPAQGDWLYFVLVNGKTGETKFSATLAEHEKGVAQFQHWLKDNPDYKTGG